jgi:glycosyltransferase involved in cell wall biosynthesis
MERKPLVSVLINNYNKTRYCVRAVKSILSQTYKNIEIIFFDDCSSDNSIENLKSNLKKDIRKIKIIKNKARGKIFSQNQMNGIYISIQKSKGTIICILDSDDFFKKEKIKYIVQYFEKNKNQNIVLDLPLYYYKQREKIDPNINYYFRKYKWSKFPPTSCISFRREGVKKVLKKIYVKKYNELWFDFRFITYFSYVKSQFNILNKHLTYYSKNSDNYDEKYKKFFNRFWWKRRYEAFKFLEYLNKKKYKKNILNLDLLLTTLTNKILKIN